MVLGVIVFLFAASWIFNEATSWRSKPVTELWSGSFVESGGVKTAYQSWGTHGTPIVLVGGFLEPTWVWEKTAESLAKDHRVYALDLDGFGYTERTGPWTLASWGDQVQGFIQALHLGNPTVVGHSLGAAVAVEVGQRGVASRIVLVDGDALKVGGPPSFVRTVLTHTPFVTSLVELATLWDYPARNILKNAYGPYRPPITHEMIDAWTRPLLADNTAKALLGMTKHGIAGFSRAELQAGTPPATVIWGELDTVDPIDRGRQTANDIHARFVVIPKAGHVSMLNNPAAVARAISTAASS